MEMDKMERWYADDVIISHVNDFMPEGKDIENKYGQFYIEPDNNKDIYDYPTNIDWKTKTDITIVLLSFRENNQQCWK